MVLLGRMNPEREEEGGSGGTLYPIPQPLDDPFSTLSKQREILYFSALCEINKTYALLRRSELKM